MTTGYEEGRVSAGITASVKCLPRESLIKSGLNICVLMISRSTVIIKLLTKRRINGVRKGSISICSFFFWISWRKFISSQNQKYIQYILNKEYFNTINTILLESFNVLCCLLLLLYYYHFFVMHIMYTNCIFFWQVSSLILCYTTIVCWCLLCNALGVL